MTNYFTEPLATELEDKRDEKRSKHRITYDCFYAVCSNGYVWCRAGDYMIRKLGAKGGGMSLYDCLSGATGTRCLKCVNFDTE